jgi:thiosulfate/3-mercaptopyruvate sulfurtransferase
MIARWFVMTLVVLAVVAVGGAPAGADEATGLLVGADWLKARLGDPNVRIVDMTTEPEDYQKAHIPGAVYLGVNDTRVGVPAGGYRLPTEAEAARLLGGLGITPASTVVVYDDMGGLHASRLFFVLEVFGHAKVALLDGGFAAWRRAGHVVTRDVPRIAPTTYRPTIAGDRVVSAEWVRDRLDNAAFAFVDARSSDEFTGRDVQARRGGHIPGAVNVEWQRNLRPDLHFKSRDELRAMYERAGVTPDKTVVTYCQTHHRAAHAYFVLRLLGFPRVVAYDRSWIEWGNRDDLPVAR